MGRKSCSTFQSRVCLVGCYVKSIIVLCCIMLYYVVSDKLIIIIPRTKSTDQCQHLKICSAVIALNKSYIQRARDNIIDILTQGVNTNHHLYPNLYIMINKVFKHSFSFFRTVFGLSNYLLRDTSKKTNSIMT